MVRFHIPGRLPGFNELVAAAKGHDGRGYGYSSLKKKWTDTVVLLAKARKLPPVKRARFTFVFTEPTPSRRCRPRDPDNIAAGGRKVILDGLVAAGVLPNDTLAEVAGWQDEFRVGGVVGCEVTIEDAA